MLVTKENWKEKTSAGNKFIPTKRQIFHQLNQMKIEELLVLKELWKNWRLVSSQEQKDFYYKQILERRVTLNKVKTKIKKLKEKKET